MKCIMIDMETLSTRLDCVILSVAAVEFDRDAADFKVIRSFDETCKLQYQIQDRHVDINTIKWWMKQSKEAQESSFEPAGAQDIHTVMHSLYRYICDVNPNEVWSKGANFDIAILEYYYTTYSMIVPWSYRAVRCFRTLQALFPQTAILPFEEGKAHIAIEDARHQAREVWNWNNFA